MAQPVTMSERPMSEKSSERAMYLLLSYPHLRRFAEFLAQKAKNPTVGDEEREEAELTLKDIRQLALDAKRQKAA